MGKLVITFDGAVLKTVPLNKERVSIGRRPENDIQIDNLGVSGEHAVIVTVGNDSVLEDLKSTNGTLLNGVLTEKQLLKNTDVIEIGKHKLKYVAEIPTATASFEKTMVIRRPGAPAPAGPPRGDDPTTIAAPMKTGAQPAAPAAPPAHTATQPAQPAPPAPAQPTDGPSRPAGLKVVSGSSAGKVLELTKNLTTLGKPGVQVVVFTRRPTGYFVAHVEGNELPMFNGQPLDAEPRQLKENDVIEISGTKLSFFYKS